MAIMCNVCKEETERFARCGHCNLRICLECSIRLYKEETGITQIFPKAGTCPQCYQYIEEEILRYIRDNHDEIPLFVNISLQYSPWNDVLKDILRGNLRGKRMFDTINSCIGNRVKL
jgi:hypothetical protein